MFFNINNKNVRIVSMVKEIKVGQKLYHFAYGPLTVTQVTHEQRGDYVNTVADMPSGYRGGKGAGEPKQTWLLDSIGHWLFETPGEVGNENNDFDWKKHWPDYTHEPVLPVRDSRDKSNWHTFYGVSGTKDGQGASPVGVSKAGGASPVGVSGTNNGEIASPVGVVKK